MINELKNELIRKPQDYYSCGFGENDDNHSLAIVARQIAAGSKVLDIGCANGALGEYLSAKKNCRVYGIDINAEAIAAIKETGHYADAFHINIETAAGDSDDFRRFEEIVDFDYIVLADVLEHLADPTTALTLLGKRLKDSGRIVISLPNMAHIDVIYNLLNGFFNYEQQGILDNTHLRFFTKKSFLLWVRELNAVLKDFVYDCVYLGSTRVTSDYFMQMKQDKPLLTRIFELNPDYNSFQILFVLTKKDAADETPELDALLLEEPVSQTRLINKELNKLEDLNDNLYKANEKLRNESARMGSELINAMGMINHLADEIGRMKATISWRITRPIRFARSVMLKIKNGVSKRLRNKRRLHAALRFAYRLPRYGVRLMRHIFTHGFKGLGGKIARRFRKASVMAPAIANIQYITPVRTALPLENHTEDADVIICVHNAHDDVKRCIESVYRHTAKPYGLIIVDDGSAALTRDYLKEVADKDKDAVLIRNESGNGYTVAANMGLRASKAKYRVLLNSDTIVTACWLDSMIQCAQSDEKIGVVGPLSNTASWQSVPLLTEDGDWAHNTLPKGVSVDGMGEWTRQYSGNIFPQVPLINGFCMMVTAPLIECIGYLDEENFPKGFGEEDDFNIRAGKAGFKLAVADNVYVYHAQSKSYTDQTRKALCETSAIAKERKHGRELIEQFVYFMRENYVFEGIRARAGVMAERRSLIEEGYKRWNGKRILFILPAKEAGGGANVILQEAQHIKDMGVDVVIYNLSEHRGCFEKAYPSLEFEVICEEKLKDLLKHAHKFDAVCSSLFSSVQYCDFSGMAEPPVVAYYVQDYEPYFFEKTDRQYKEAMDSYTVIPSTVCVTKTRWNAQTVKENTGKDCCIIGPSVNIDLFRPRRAFPNDRRIHICAMVRPHSPRRGPAMTMKVFRRIARQYEDKVNMEIFGSDPSVNPNDAAFFAEHGKGFRYTNLGLLMPEQVAALMNRSDIFVDFSTYQAMGLTAMEAMASGCATIMTCHGGSGDFVVHESNCLVIDTLDEAACYDALSLLIENDALRKSMAKNAIRDMCAFYPEKCAYKFLEAVFGAEGA